MIGKLIKNDLKAGARQMANIYLAAAIACVAMLASAFVQSGFLRFLCSAALIIIAGIAVIITFVSVVGGANKTLFGRQGYLTQTLPVRTNSLIFSKWFTSSIWVLISYALVVFVTVAVFLYWTAEDQGGAEIYEMVYGFLQGLLGLGEQTVYRNYLIIQSIIGLFNACIIVMFIIFAITLSNIRPFHKLGSIGTILYIAATLGIVQGAAWGLEKLCDISLIIRESGMTMTVSQSAVEAAINEGSMTIGFTGVYFKVLVTAFIYILTVYLTEKKVNLK
ncbi:MAG: hypothetical protein LUG85_07990 [Clostridiales bacterium]|nr:hypothetical protein [Clostridiales bacterium]